MSAKALNEKPANEEKTSKDIKKKQSNFRMIGLIIATLVLGSVLLYHISKENEQVVPTKPVIIKPYINKIACVVWILKRSSKISKDMAVDIFETAMSTDHGLLLLALASRESSFNPSAVSKAGAIGLNQIMPSIWVEELIKNKIIKEKRDLFNYKANLKASHYILTKYYKETGSWEKALKKYVGADSKAYVKDVLANCGELYLLSKSK